jgi:Flp pilus assembly protein TadG
VFCSRKKSLLSGEPERGTAALELAILLPVLLTILFGIIDWGYVFYVDLSLTNAAREGARVGVTKTLGAQPGPEAAARDKAEAYLESAGLGSGGHNSPSVVTSFDNVNVTVTTSIDSFTPLVGFLPDAALPQSLRARAVMRWEMEGVTD